MYYTLSELDNVDCILPIKKQTKVLREGYNNDFKERVIELNYEDTNELTGSLLKLHKKFNNINIDNSIIKQFVYIVEFLLIFFSHKILDDDFDKSIPELSILEPSEDRVRITHFILNQTFLTAMRSIPELFQKIIQILKDTEFSLLRQYFLTTKDEQKGLKFLLTSDYIELYMVQILGINLKTFKDATGYEQMKEKIQNVSGIQMLLLTLSGGSVLHQTLNIDSLIDDNSLTSTIIKYVTQILFDVDMGVGKSREDLNHNDYINGFGTFKIDMSTIDESKRIDITPIEYVVDKEHTLIPDVLDKKDIQKINDIELSTMNTRTNIMLFQQLLTDLDPYVLNTEQMNTLSKIFNNILEVKNSVSNDDIDSCKDAIDMFKLQTEFYSFQSTNYTERQELYNKYVEKINKTVDEWKEMLKYQRRIDPMSSTEDTKPNCLSWGIGAAANWPYKENSCKFEDGWEVSTELNGNGWPELIQLWTNNNARDGRKGWLAGGDLSSGPFGIPSSEASYIRDTWSTHTSFQTDSFKSTLGDFYNRGKGCYMKGQGGGKQCNPLGQNYPLEQIVTNTDYTSGGPECRGTGKVALCALTTDKIKQLAIEKSIELVNKMEPFKTYIENQIYPSVIKDENNDIKQPDIPTLELPTINSNIVCCGQKFDLSAGNDINISDITINCKGEQTIINDKPDKPDKPGKQTIIDDKPTDKPKPKDKPKPTDKPLEFIDYFTQEPYMYYTYSAIVIIIFLLVILIFF